MSTISQYETHAGDGDQKATAADLKDQQTSPDNSHKLNDYHDSRSLATRAKDEKEQEKAEKRAEQEEAEKPHVFEAEKHGNKPSRGAKIDAEIEAEEAELLRRKDEAGKS